ncbi:HlyD family efflux transporter periplasmic adaptor subunit, partial [Bdellovibrionota bacterium]
MKLKFFLIAFILFFISSPALAGKTPPASKTPPGFPVGVETISMGEVGQLLKYVGGVSPNMQASVYSSINGRFDDIKVGSGKSVKKKQILGYVVNDTPGYRYVRHPVRAPFKGIVTAVGFDPGSAIRTTDALFEVTNLDTLYFDSYIPQHDAVRINKGEPATVTLDAFGRDLKLEATVVSIGTVTNDKTGLVSLSFELKPTDKPIKINMTGEVSLQIDRHEGI